MKEGDKVDWKQIAKLLGKSKSQCQNHYAKLMESCWTKDMD